MFFFSWDQPRKLCEFNDKLVRLGGGAEIRREVPEVVDKRATWKSNLDTDTNKRDHTNLRYQAPTASYLFNQRCMSLSVICSFIG